MSRKHIIIFCLAAFGAAACDGWLEPLPNGTYNEENHTSYPRLIRGYVDKAYNKLPSTYYATEFIGTDAVTDDAVYREPTRTLRQYSLGFTSMGSNPFSTVWTRDYEGIYYVNLFLDDDIGYNTHYLVDPDRDATLRRVLKGDAFGLRAWFLYELLKTFGGRDAAGNLLGVPVFTRPFTFEEITEDELRRASFDDCARQIIADCDSALKYLPLANRDFLLEEGESNTLLGGIRYKQLDQVSVQGIKALTYLLWASPAFNPDGDKTRWTEAARAAAAVMRHKLEKENVLNGFDPAKRFFWTSPNSPEAVWISDAATTSAFETNFYPNGFNGAANVVCTQDFVDAFPMANGYPVTDPRSGYDPTHPYDGRDPRFYSTVFYNGSSVVRTSTGTTSYTFDTAVGGKDAPGGNRTSPTGYYIRKYLYMEWNADDDVVMKMPHCIFFLRWAQMCLVFAEAANHAVGPLDADTFGYSARQALAWLRNRPTVDNLPGLGSEGDPYLDECAAGGEAAFDALVRNEWRLETCFEGQRYWHLRRWASSLAEINGPVRGVEITARGDGTFRYDFNKVIETKAFTSLYSPLPYTEVRKAPTLVQNQGWETWR